MTNLTNEFVVSIVTSTEEYPIKLDDVWEWLGYSTKGNAVRSFESCGFAETLDFIRFITKDKTGAVVRELENIAMTTDCFKSWSMMARTEKGKEVRQYFLRVEKEYRAEIANKAQTVAKALPPMWRENRLLLSDVETGYQRWCKEQGFSPNHLTNAIYKQVCNGDNAAALRLKALVEGNPSIAANHIEQPELVEEVALLKQQLTRYKRQFADMYVALAAAVGALETRRG